MRLLQETHPNPLPPFTRRDLPDLALSDADLDRLLQAGDVLQPVRGAYLDARTADQPEVRAAAAALILPPGVVAARRLAAWLHGVDARGPGQQHQPLPLEYIATRQVRRHGVRVWQADLPAEDVVRLGGVQVTSAARTACDVARYLQPFLGLAVTDALAHAGKVDRVELLAMIERWRGRRNVARARRLIGLCEPETESFGEPWLRLRLIDAGFPRPEPQIWIVDGHGVGLYRLDMGWRDRRIAVEYDGEEFHSDPDHVEHDEARRAKLADEHGWHVVGVGKGLVLGRSLDLERGVGELLGLEPAIRTRRW